MRLLKLIAMPVTLIVNVGKALWFLACAASDALWVGAFGKKDK